MTNQEIEQAANSFIANNAKVPHIDHWSFRQGANFVNENQPYSANDLHKFWIWANANGWYCANLTELWYNDETGDVPYEIEEIIKLWEESK